MTPDRPLKQQFFPTGAGPNALCLVLAVGFCAGCASLQADDDRQARRVTPVVEAFRKAKPAVVNISTTRVVTYQRSFGFDGLFDDIFGRPSPGRSRRYKTTSVGSGFVIHRDGYVVTNAHVVARTTERKIGFVDGTERPADVVAIDTENDLAILKVESDTPLPFLKLGCSDDLMPGETVIVVGNPLGYGHTVTTGIVSALNRELYFSENVVYRGLIQTDAPINPGNSGGPLLNVLGELIGINTAIRGDAQNIGFAIPVDHVHRLLPRLLDIERLRRVSFGIGFGSNVDNHGVAGVLVDRVASGSPAGAAGIRRGDIITEIEGHATPNFMEAFGVLDGTPPGKILIFRVAGENGRVKAVKLALAEIPKPDGEKLMLDRLGVRIRELTRRERRELGLRRSGGLLVKQVQPGSQAFKKRVEPGDVVTKIGGRPVGTLDHVGHLLEAYDRGDIIRVGFIRIGRHVSIHVELTLKAR